MFLRQRIIHRCVWYDRKSHVLGNHLITGIPIVGFQNDFRRYVILMKKIINTFAKILPLFYEDKGMSA